MKTTLSLVFASMIGLVAPGCGSGGDGTSGGPGAPPDFAAIESRLTTPTGTFSAGQERAVTDGFTNQASAASNGNAFGGGPTTTVGTSSFEIGIRTLAPLTADPQCPGIKNGGRGTCACPGGGSLSYDLPAGGLEAASPAAGDTRIDQTAGITASSCQGGEGELIDGSIFWRIKSPPPFMLFAIHLSITGGPKAGRYDIDFLYANRELTLSVDVPDGNVIVSAKGQWDGTTKTGTLVIKAKNGTWTCTATNGTGECKSDTGETRPIGG